VNCAYLTDVIGDQPVVVCIIFLCILLCIIWTSVVFLLYECSELGT